MDNQVLNEPVSPKIRQKLEVAQDVSAQYPPINPMYRAPREPTEDLEEEETYMPEFLAKQEMHPQIVPSKFADCKSLKDV